jgi:hypothetical protein
MTLNQARKILGKEAKGVSDEELSRDIETAMLLKDLFFNKLTKDRKRLARSS